VPAYGSVGSFAVAGCWRLGDSISSCDIPGSIDSLNVTQAQSGQEQTMKKKALQVKTQLEIAKPVHQVFEAIVDPEKMSHYFISSGRGYMENGKTVHWNFDTGAGLDAKVERIEPDRFVSFFWSASGIEALVAVELVPSGDSGTLVKISESKWPPNEKGIARCIEQTQGWMHFLCCMKAYLEYGINLRTTKPAESPRGRPGNPG
jgi:uncharacterized protein YndB with AHSA1/START domain